MTTISPKIPCPLCRDSTEPVMACEIAIYDTCIACEENPIEITFDCKHSCMCSECYDKLKKTYKKSITRYYPQILEPITNKNMGRINKMNMHIFSLIVPPDADKVLPKNIKVAEYVTGHMRYTRDNNDERYLFVTRYMTEEEKQILFTEYVTSNVPENIHNVIYHEHTSSVIYRRSIEPNRIKFIIYNNIGLVVTFLVYDINTKILSYRDLTYKNIVPEKKCVIM